MKSLKSDLFNSKKINNSSNIFGGGGKSQSFSNSANTCVFTRDCEGNLNHDGDSCDPD